MKLDIQMLADAPANTIDPVAVAENSKAIKDNGEQINESVNTIYQSVNKLLMNDSFRSIAGDALKVAFDAITPHLGEFSVVTQDLGKFLDYAVRTYEISDQQMAKEYDDWRVSVTGAIGNIKSGFTEVASGYTSGQYVLDVGKSARNIAVETVNIIANTGRLYSSATGKSPLTSLVDIGKATVGTVKTLFGWITKNNSIGSSFVNGLVNAQAMPA